MSIFSKILSVLGIGHANATPAPPASHPVGAPSPVVASAPRPIAISDVDVVGKLEALAKSHPEKLNWKVSIVDLLKLLGIDSSLNNRKELAVELHCPTDKMGDSAAMNMWLQKAVLRKLADNGGNIPADLLD